MKMKLKTTVALILFACAAHAQDAENENHTVEVSIPEVALLDIESNSGKNITLLMEAPTEAGLPISMSKAIDSSLWLNYSSVTTGNGNGKRDISAKVTSGSVPKGMDLYVKPLAYTGNGDGDLGSPQNNSNNGIKLGSNNKKIIKDIKTCYTGNGAGNGHQLVYSLQLKNNKYEDIDFDESTTLAVLYTISD